MTHYDFDYLLGDLMARLKPLPDTIYISPEVAHTLHSFLSQPRREPRRNKVVAWKRKKRGKFH